MSLGNHCRVHALIWVTFSTCVPFATMCTAHADNTKVQTMGPCVQPLSFYSRSHYKIAAIRPTSPFDYLHRVRQLMDDAIAAAGVQVGADFTAQSVTRGRRKIRERLKQEATTQNLPIMVDVVIAGIDNCQSDTQPPSLDVVYNTFSTWAPFVFTKTFEHQASLTEDPASASGIKRMKFQLLPQLG